MDALPENPVCRALPPPMRRALLRALLGAVRGRITSYGPPPPTERLLSSLAVLCDELLPALSRGGIAPKGAVARSEVNEVLFTDGSRERIAAVICCTDYRMDAPFLPEGLLPREGDRAGLYLLVVPPAHQGLFLAGFVRGTSPQVSTLVPLFEEQAEWIADLVDGTCALPPAAVVEAEINAHRLRGRRSDAESPYHVSPGAYVRRLRRGRAAGGGRSRLRTKAPKRGEPRFVPVLPETIGPLLPSRPGRSRLHKPEESGRGPPTLKIKKLIATENIKNNPSTPMAENENIRPSPHLSHRYFART